MTTMQRIGELDVPAMALGTMYFGTNVPPAGAHACLDRAFEIGARFWDTANNYAFWTGGTGNESEETIGDWLTAHGPRARDEIVLATKIGARPSRPGGGLDDVLGLSRSAVREQVLGSLRRLRTDRIDLLYAHVDDRRVPFEETLGALDELVSEGMVRTVAASNLTASRLREAMSAAGLVHYQGLQQRFTYLVPDVNADLSPHVLLDDEISDLCTEHGLARLGYSPLLSGAYTRTDRALPDGYGGSKTALAILAEIADQRGLDAGQAVLSWMTSRREPVTPVVGVSRPAHVDAAWDAISTSLSDAETERLDQARHA